MKGIFISYSHDSEEHCDRVLSLSNRLIEDGLDCILDQYETSPPEGWPKWMDKHLRDAEWVLVICTETYYKRVIGEEKPGKGRGVKWESTLSYQHIYDDDSNKNRFIPVIFDSKNESYIPTPFKGGTWYCVDSEEGYDALYRRLTDQPAVKKPEKGQLKVRPAKERKRDIFSKSSLQNSTVLLTELPAWKITLFGRDNELNILETRLKQTNRVLLINGLGGIGKTEVCKRFFRNHYKEYTFVGWFDYVSSLKDSLVNALDWDSLTAKKYLEADPKDKPDVRFRRFMGFLKHQELNVLLVIDNIEDEKDNDLEALLRLPENVKVIANSRQEIEGFELHELEFLNIDDCQALFYEFYKGEKDEATVEKIVDLCGRHTLTVELLARTAQMAALQVKDLYDMLREKGFNLNAAISDRVGTFWHDEKERKCFFNHLLTIFDISRVTESELHLLTNLSVLPSVYIPIADISGWLGLETKEDVHSMVRKGWLRHNKLKVFIHPIIREVIRFKTYPDVEKCEKLVTSLTQKLKCEQGDNPLEKKDYVIFAESVLQNIDEVNQKLAGLSNNLSEIYHHLGQLDNALEYQLKAVSIRKEVLKKNHPDLAESYNNLAAIYWLRNQFDKALEYQLKAVNICEKVLNKNHPRLAVSYNVLSLIYLDLKQFELAKEYQFKAINIREKVTDIKTPDLATSYNNLSFIYKGLNQFEKALEYQLKALAIREKVLNKNHPNLADSYNNLATIYHALKDYESAEKYGEKGVAILQNLFPDGHPNLNVAKKNLEEIKSSRGSHSA